MGETSRESLAELIKDFHLPVYDEIPTVGLYLEQVTRYIADYLAPLQEDCITNSMISNYVKKHLIDSPMKKQYSRDQIAYLIFIAVVKSVLSLDNLRIFIELQKQSYDSRKAYNYFCGELENVLAYVFGLKDTMDEVGHDMSDEKVMLRSAIIAVAHKIYLEKYFEAIAES